jgi:hypothetical protein
VAPLKAPSPADEQLAELLDRYMSLAMDNAPKGGAASALSKSHFQVRTASVGPVGFLDV